MLGHQPSTKQHHDEFLKQAFYEYNLSNDQTETVISNRDDSKISPSEKTWGVEGGGRLGLRVGGGISGIGGGGGGGGGQNSIYRAGGFE